MFIRPRQRPPLRLAGFHPLTQPLPSTCCNVRMCNMAAISVVLVALFLAHISLGKLLLPTWNEQAAQDDYDVLKYPPDRPSGFAFWLKEGVVKSTSRSYNAHIAVLSGGFPNTFSLQLPIGGIDG